MSNLSIVLVSVPAGTQLSVMPGTIQRIIGKFLQAEGADAFNIQTHRHEDNGEELKGMVIRDSEPEDVEFLLAHPAIIAAGWTYLAGQAFNISAELDDDGNETGETTGLHKTLAKADCLRFQNDVSEPSEDDPEDEATTRRPTESEIIAPIVVSGANPTVIE